MKPRIFLQQNPTALAERPGGVVFEINASLGKNLDVTSRGIIDYDMAHSIARGSRKHGFDSITFNSAQLKGGVNTVIFDPINAMPK